jgi:hypothetical protein
MREANTALNKKLKAKRKVAAEKSVKSCERSVGTVFQLPSPDAIYSQDKEEERRWSPSLVVGVRARSTCC